MLIIALVWVPLASRVAEPAPGSPAPSSMLPRIAANVAVYGSLYAVALTLLQATSTVIVSVSPPAALGTVLDRLGWAPQGGVATARAP